MAHEIEGDYAFFVKNAPWHTAGHVISDAPTFEEALRRAYPWTLHKLDLAAIVTDDDGEQHYQELQKFSHIMREDGKEIGCVTKSWELLQAWESGLVFEPLIDSGLVDLEAGGSLYDGKRMWLLGKVRGADADIVKGDQVKGYVLFSQGFDGGFAARTGGTNTRVVCANTLAMALADVTKEDRANQDFFTFKHTKNIRDKIADAGLIIRKRLDAFSKQVEGYKTLASMPASEEKMKAYISSVFIPDGTPEDKVTAPMLAKVSRCVELLEMETVPAARGTMWQPYNAVTAYLTHEQGRTDATRLASQWYGDSAALNRRAFNLALQQ